MNTKRGLRLRREVLTELRDGELESVVGATIGTFSMFGTCAFTECIPTWCITCVSCLCTEGCETRPCA